MSKKSNKLNLSLSESRFIWKTISELNEAMFKDNREKFNKACRALSAWIDLGEYEEQKAECRRRHGNRPMMYVSNE